jgi:hypothetical protein
MTKSKISLLSDDDISSILATYLRGQYTLRELQEKLKDLVVIRFDPSTGEREIQDLAIPEGISVQVAPSHLRHMLQEFIETRVSEEELCNWAALVYMATFFVPEGETEEDRWQAGEGILWEIIQELADPNKVDSLDSALAQKYLGKLSNA